jgi:hypothetical protein
VPDLFIERKELTLKKSIHDEDDDDDFLLKKLGALKKKAANNQGEGDGVKIAPATTCSIVIGGMKKSGLICTMKNESGAESKKVEKEESYKPSVSVNYKSVPLPRVEETDSKCVPVDKDLKEENKVETIQIKKEENDGSPAKIVSTLGKVTEEKTEKRVSNITFRGLKISVGTDGAKTVSGDAEKAAEAEEKSEKKVPVLQKLGIKISKMSSELISSGLTFDNKRNRIIEEGLCFVYFHLKKCGHAVYIYRACRAYMY